MKSYSDIKGDGGSRIVEQIVLQRRKIAQQLSGIRHLVAVGSGKGGVGKSTLTMQLALSLTEQGKRVSILDADFNGPSMARLAGVNDPLMIPGPCGMLLPRTEDGIGLVSLGSVLPEDQNLEFPTVSEGDSYVWRATREFAALADLIAGTEWGELDYLLIDLPPGPERTFQFAEFFGPALNLVLVTIPSDISCGVVQRSVASVQRSRSRLLGFVENMKGYLCPDSAELKPLFPEGKVVSLGIPRLGEVPFEPMLARLADHGLSIESWSILDVTSYVKEVADNISKLLEPYEIPLRRL